MSAMSMSLDRGESAFLPDPLSFTVAALAGRGALAEPVEEPMGAQGTPRALVLLPGEVAREYSLPEEVMLSPEQEVPGAVPCGLGTPLLSRLVAEGRAQVPVTFVRLGHDPPRPHQGASLGARFVVRNGVSEVLDAFPGEGTYVFAAVGYVAEADDRHEGVVRVVVHGQDGSAPAEDLLALLDPARNV